MQQVRSIIKRIISVHSNKGCLFQPRDVPDSQRRLHGVPTSCEWPCRTGAGDIYPTGDNKEEEELEEKNEKEEEAGYRRHRVR